MKRIVVIGIGSLIMKDDSIGVRVLEKNKNCLLENGICTVLGETDFQYCYDEINPDDFVVIIDAQESGNDPGSLNIMPLCEAVECRERFKTSHEFSLFDLIELNMPKLSGKFIGIEVCEVDFGFDLSKPIENRFSEICSSVLKEILKIRGEVNNA